MNEFVEECRREWKRLHVPDAVANEMAADLEADLAEAEAEGASAEDVLGSSAFDPTSFAASWAAERGVIHSTPANLEPSRRSRVLGAVAVAASVAVIGAAVAMLAAPSDSARVALARPFAFRAAAATVIRVFGPGRVAPRPAFRAVWVPAPRLLLPRVAAARSFAVRLSIGGHSLRTSGLILLIVGIAGLFASLLSWSRWAIPGHRY